MKSFAIDANITKASNKWCVKQIFKANIAKAFKPQQSFMQHVRKWHQIQVIHANLHSTKPKEREREQETNQCVKHDWRFFGEQQCG